MTRPTSTPSGALWAPDPPHSRKRTASGRVAQLGIIPPVARQFRKSLRRRGMEPGGIEPPCRDRSSNASTRVVAVHISIRPCPATGESPGPASSQVSSLPPPEGATRGVQPDVIWPFAHRASAKSHADAIYAASANWVLPVISVARLLTRPACAATRHDRPCLSGRNQSAPGVKERRPTSGRHRRRTLRRPA